MVHLPSSIGCSGVHLVMRLSRESWVLSPCVGLSMTNPSCLRRHCIAWIHGNTLIKLGPPLNLGWWTQLWWSSPRDLHQGWAYRLREVKPTFYSGAVTLSRGGATATEAVERGMVTSLKDSKKMEEKSEDGLHKKIRPRASKGDGIPGEGATGLQTGGGGSIKSPQSLWTESRQSSLTVTEMHELTTWEW